MKIHVEIKPQTLVETIKARLKTKRAKSTAILADANPKQRQHWKCNQVEGKTNGN